MGKLHEPIWQVQFLVSEKFFCAYLHQIAIKIMLLIVNNLHEKRIIESQEGEILLERALFVICNVFKIGLTLHEKCSRFSISNHMILSAIWNKQAEANFFTD